MMKELYHTLKKRETDSLSVVSKKSKSLHNKGEKATSNLLESRYSPTKYDLSF